MKKKRSYQRLTFKENCWLKKLANRYKLQTVNIEKLLKRVDIIPISLALSQAILESGWGTSRFAVQGNALFGIHLHNDSASDSISNISGTVKMVSYRSLSDSVRSYYYMLNTSPAYQSFREIRKEYRQEHKPLDSIKLAGTLELYSELGKTYTQRVRSIITRFKLHRYDQVSLLQDVSPIALRFSRKS